MMKVKLIPRAVTPDDGGLYFPAKADVETFSSGCSLLDCVIGGGWPIGRIANIVGDKSTGKTLLAIEACANFMRKYPDGTITYAEVEAAFDQSYASALGLPDKIRFPANIFTVEDVFQDLEKRVERALKTGRPALYIIDSLDALSDKAELGREIDAGSYNTQKAAKVGQLFRRLVQRIKGSRMTVIFISQERDLIGVTFGKKSTRSGGRAMDFYASQVLWLAHIGRIKKTRKGVDRVIGIKVRAKCEKNKIAMPFRECDFPILFSFGVEDVVAGTDWLIKVGKAREVFPTTKEAKRFLLEVQRLDVKEYNMYRRKIARAVRSSWDLIERDFTPKRRKYALAGS